MDSSIYKNMNVLTIAYIKILWVKKFRIKYI